MIAGFGTFVSRKTLASERYSMTRLLTSITAAALLLAVGTGAQAQMSPAPNATAPANPAMSGTAMQRGTAPAPMPAPMSAPATPMTDKPMHARRHMAAKPMAGHHMGRTAHMGRSQRMAPREAGSASVDQLNEQSLARARAGQ